MRVFCAGFNLYGQFQNIRKKLIETFECTDYEHATDIQISHSFLIVKTNYQHKETSTTSQTNENIHLHGFLNNKTHQIKELLFGKENIIQTSTSDVNALFLSDKGHIWNLKNNNNANYDLGVISDSTKTEKCEESSDDYIVRVACGHVTSYAYSYCGFIFSIPNKHDFKNLEIKDIQAGREHCLILTTDGFVYSFGSGSRGQLGHGDVEDRLEPKLIDALCGIKITRINCGAWHSTAISAQGDLYTWGWNSNGQLGLVKTIKDETTTTCGSSREETDCVAVMASPNVVELDWNVVDVACGSRHTVVLLENSQLYGCGWNKYCQLGFKSKQENYFGMTHLYDFNDMTVLGLRCGPWNSVVLVN